MKQTAVRLEAIQLADPVDKILWEQHIDFICRLIIEEYKESQKSTLPTEALDKAATKKQDYTQP
ncbi:MAG: hypothetical protein WCK75_10840 [Elusimicrobiota bacterium]